MKNRTVTVVIPNWNGEELLRRYFGDVMKAIASSEAIVVDDASTDGSVAYLKKNYPKVNIIRKATHEGYASTVNRGVEAALGEIVVLLNTDVVPTIGFLGPLLKHFEDPEVFAVGCLDKSQEGNTIVERGRGIAQWQNGFYIHRRGDTDKTDTAWVSGGSGAFRRSMWLKLGGMDELFNPFYWEDIDLSYRAIKAGYKLVFEPKSIVNHYHEEGKIKLVYSPFSIKTIAYRNQFIFIWKNAFSARIFIEHLFWLPVRIIQALLNGDTAFLIGLFQALRMIRLVLNKKKYKVID